MRRRLEKSIEASCKRWAYARGWWGAKFKSPGKRSAPDDIFVRWGFHIFVEFNAEDEKATENQQIYHAEMRAAGCIVIVIDNVDAFKAKFIELEKRLTPAWLRD
jgi:hypothetical protein